MHLRFLNCCEKKCLMIVRANRNKCHCVTGQYSVVLDGIFLFVCLFVYEVMNLYISIRLMIRIFDQSSSLLEIHKLCTITLHTPCL